MVQLVSWVQDRLDSRDVVVVDTYGTSSWTFMMNNWSSNTPWYSLPHEVPAINANSSEDFLTSSPAVSLFTNLSEGYERIWYVSSGEAFDNPLRELQWLRDNFTLSIEATLAQERDIRAYVFELRTPARGILP